MNAVAGARDVPAEDAGHRGVQIIAHEGEVLRIFHVLADGFEVPERCIDGVVFRLLAGVGKTVRQHAHIGGAAEGEQDVARNIEPAGGQRQARQRNHSVAAPVGEPVIAGDHGMQIGGTPDDELRGRGVEWVFWARRGPGGWKRGMRFGGGDHRCFGAGPKLELHHQRLEQVFLEIQPALPLARVLEIVVPTGFGIDPAGVVREVQGRESIVRMDRNLAGNLRETSVERTVGMGCGVIIAKCDERAQFQGAGRVLADLILDNCGVFPCTMKTRFSISTPPTS